MILDKLTSWFKWSINRNLKSTITYQCNCSFIAQGLRIYYIFQSLPLLHLAKLILPKELLWRKVSSFLMKASIYRRAMRTVFPSISELLQWGSTNRCFYFFAWFFWRCLLYCNTKLYHLLQTWIGNNECHLVISKYLFGPSNVTILLILVYSEENNNVLVFDNNREKSSINLQQPSR